MDTYKIVRFFRTGKRQIKERGLSLEDAQEHCSDERTHKKDKHGDVIWFDGYTIEE